MKRTCSFCRTLYVVPAGATIDEYRTADPYPPASVVIKADGVLVHQCERGHDTTLGKLQTTSDGDFADDVPGPDAAGTLSGFWDNGEDESL